VPISFVYHSPTTPGNPGFSVNLGTQAVRSGDIPGLSTEAELGAVATSSLRFDDPTGSAGNAGDAIKGLKQLSISESLAPSGNRRIGEYYIGDRRYYRGSQGVSPSLRTGSARVIDMALADINSFLSFRIFRADTNGSNTSFNRPAETDVQRVTAMLAVSFLSDTLFDGLVSTSGPVDMDACDYTSQRPADVLNDCAQQSGKNFFVFYDEAGTYTPSPGDYGLFYRFNDDAVYDGTMDVTNDIDENPWDGTTVSTWAGIVAPWQDAVLVRDPSRVIAGAFANNGSNSVYREQASTSYEFGWRDAVVDTRNLKTVPKIEARLDRYLSENDTEDDRITFTVQVPPAHVNDWKEGQRGRVKFTHLPGYTDWTYVRALQRTVIMDEQTDDRYKIRIEATPLSTAPSGGQDSWQPGDGSYKYGNTAGGSIPTLPRVTTPGNLLILFYSCLGSLGYEDYPNEPILHTVDDGSNYPWTTLETVGTFDYRNKIDHRWPIPDATHGSTDGFPVRAGVAYRFAQPGETTVKPVQVIPNGPGATQKTTGWLWEFATHTAPTHHTSAQYDPSGIGSWANPGPPAPSHLDVTIGSDLPGWVLGMAVIGGCPDWAMTPIITPGNGDVLRAIPNTGQYDGYTCNGNGVSDVNGRYGVNRWNGVEALLYSFGCVGGHWSPPFQYLAQSPTGTAITFHMGHYDMNNTVPGFPGQVPNWSNYLYPACVAVAIPDLHRPVADIPWPGNISA
jgi:hypothetical protein